MPTEQPPFYIGRYLVTGRLGSGGMGVVYLATDERLGRQVAIKRLVKNPSSSSAHLRIRQEALLLAQLNHSNIVQIYDVVEERNDVALVMEYVDGCSLTYWQRERNPGLIQKVRLLKQICNGLSRAHSIGIIHRDLKADNILIDSDNTAKIGDFGIAKNWRETSDLTREQHIAGSWGAMSPEQAQGKPLDNRSDLFSLGVLAYQLLCEQNPFGDCESPYVLVDRIVNSQHPPASKLNPELPAALSQLLDRLLAKDQTQRPLNAASVAAELEAIAVSLENRRSGFSGSRTVTITAEDYHRRRQRKPVTGRAWIGIAAAVAGLLLTAAALALLLPKVSSTSDGKYIALISPAAMPEQSREARLLVQSALNAIKHGLSNRDGLYLVPYSESQALRGQPLERQAQALNAQLLLNPDISCGPTLCDLSLELIDSEGLFVVAHRSLSLNLNGIKGGFEQTLQQVNYLLPKFPPRERDPNLSIGEEDYRRYLELETNSFDYRTAEVTEETLDALEELREKAPLFPPIYELYGKLAYDHRYTNRNTDSIERLDKFLAKAPAQIAGTAEVLGARLFLANARYDWQEAGQVLAQLKMIMPDPARYYYMEAVYHHLRGDYDQALNAVDKALAMRTSTTHLMQKAVTLSYAGEMEAAKPYLQRVLETDNNYTDATSLLAANELDMGRTGETIRLLGTVSPDRLSALDLYNLCTAHYLEKNYVEADHCFDELYIALPSDVEPLLYRAEIARELQQPEKARQLSERVVELNRDREGWDNQLILALAYAQLGQPERAVETLFKIRRDAPDDIYVNHIRAQIYITTEDLVSTKAHIRKTLELGQSPIWYHTSRFAKVCTHSGFADLYKEYPALCPGGIQNTQVARQ
ncbi:MULTISPECIES: protein kinase [unclassified Microbulbifer]|uniref:protein kinase domain-containing protein n=1 Tax=unclassified Microbulbifer TaxID=2619833 RepID=UPI0027E57B96|nr:MULTISPECIES: protein kinase [unclassified Microbulbifer]